MRDTCEANVGAPSSTSPGGNGCGSALVNRNPKKKRKEKRAQCDDGLMRGWEEDGRMGALYVKAGQDGKEEEPAVAEM